MRISHSCPAQVDALHPRLSLLTAAHADEMCNLLTAGGSKNPAGRFSVLCIAPCFLRRDPASCGRGDFREILTGSAKEDRHAL